MHLAAYGGHAECVKLLLAHGASTGVTNEYQETALQTAVGAKKQECVDILRLARS